MVGASPDSTPEPAGNSDTVDGGQLVGLIGIGGGDVGVACGPHLAVLGAPEDLDRCCGERGCGSQGQWNSCIKR
jgi:hypothetical protein